MKQKKNGIVQINVIKKYSKQFELQDKIKEKYKLKNVFISSEKSRFPKEEVGLLCADYIENNINGNEKIGISFGTTVHEYIKNASYNDFPDITITPLMGGVEFKSEALHSNQLCFRLANKYNCEMNFFYAPVIAESIEQRNILMESKLVQKAINDSKNVDIGVFGIGNPSCNSTYQKLKYISDNQLKVMEEKGIIGDICTSFYNKNAEIIETDVSKLLIGLTLNDIIKIPEVIVLATGTQKSLSLSTLLEHNYIDTLIIDFELAKTLI